MAGYKTHDRLTLYTALLLGPACYGAVTHLPLWDARLQARPWRTTLLFLGAYLFSGLLLSSDLDTASRVYRRWGPLRLLWYPYQRLVAHRSFLSHGLLGPLLRLAYLYGVVELLLLIGYRLASLAGYPTQVAEAGLRLTAQVLPFLVAHPHLSVPLLAGLLLGGVVHALVDLGS
ncbi:MAG: hypothetical protein KatS3mg131_2145 [Candidatus Tectimicrobiota bacterium]|nr:MAG: hypothetical protein KatS3mg131_2145 [Candidatus Tectomicrobia bacterium]